MRTFNPVQPLSSSFQGAPNTSQALSHKIEKKSSPFMETGDVTFFTFLTVLFNCPFKRAEIKLFYLVVTPAANKSTANVRILYIHIHKI